ncbi:MAG TPA: tail fiber protein [Chitinophagaceae bacterium]|jgi:microcystin-dependent protein|nr:tail fiber protein [Bacteroidia bacterium]HUM97694.1 tail fiber protein [Chitinophagaceae bacterium]
MSDQPFIGEIKLFGGNFEIVGHAFCRGQLLSIAQNSALFALLGTIYGGDGQSTFGLPDLRGRVPINQGVGPGLSQRTIGEVSGVENVSLTTNQIPAHNHLLSAAGSTASSSDPTNNRWASQPSLGQYETVSSGSNLKSSALGITGGSQPHSNLQPYIAINYLIALEGIFPSRN